MTTTTQAAEPARSPRVVDVELLAIDLTTCTRCTGTESNVEKAVEIVARAAEATGTSIRFRKTLIESEEDARRHRFVSSPTIRVAGRDLVFETRESLCESCTDLCGCSEGTSCRVWSYQGSEHTEAPVGLIVEGLLREISGAGPSSTEASDYEVPENLRRFFAGRKSTDAEASACCAPAEEEACCAPSEKATCCATAETA